MNNNPAQKLDNPFRRKMLPPKETLLAFDIKDGDHIADIGCGIGYFTIPAAGLVGKSGLVFGVDVSDAMLEETRRRASEAGVTNVRLIKSEENHIPIDDASVSVVFCCAVLHEVANLNAVLAETFRLLQSNGKLIVIEWDKRIEDIGPPDSHRLGKDLLRSAIGRCGYTNIKLGTLGGHFYTVTAMKPE